MMLYDGLALARCYVLCASLSFFLPASLKLLLSYHCSASPQDFNLPLAVALGACSFEAYNLPYHMYGIKVGSPTCLLDAQIMTLKSLIALVVFSLPLTKINAGYSGLCYACTSAGTSTKGEYE